MSRESSVNKTAAKLFLAALGMFGFGYLLVPLYNVFCEVTGLNGKTGQIEAADVNTADVDPTRTVVVQFDTNTRELPWDFRAVDFKVKVHPGELGEARFVVHNQSDRPIVGRAIPSVAPTTASVYFNKTECFCFDEQLLQAGESKQMVVKFVVGTNMPSHYESLILSYTFFEVPAKEDVAGLGTVKEDKPRS